MQSVCLGVFLAFLDLPSGPMFRSAVGVSRFVVLDFSEHRKCRQRWTYSRILGVA
jgi:hypothetical protein